MQNIWEQVLTKLEKQINRPSFNTWLRPTRCLALDNQHVRVGVPDDVFVYWLGEYYVHVITDALTDILGFQPAVSFVVTEEHTRSGGNTVELRLGARAHCLQNEGGQDDRAPKTTALRSDGEPQAQPTTQVTVVERSIRQNASSSSNNGQNIVTSRRNAMKPARPRPSFLHEDMPPESSPPSRGQPIVMESPAPPPAPAPRSITGSLNQDYTFESFVVGSGNRLAHAASLAVATQMASNYNPLFIYGGVGLGKTHLLHAIGHELTGIIPQSRVLYLPSEQFINDMVNSIRNDQMVGFREKYRNIDLLLVDDIQFIARKERTQEEFFHTFNTLYQAKKQIVLTSDCPPKKIPTIAEQLRSRFEWGLIADIQPPDLETRIAILKKKAEFKQMCLPDNVALFIATKMKSNIRELEGGLAKIKAYTNLTEQKVSLELAQRVLHDLVDTTPKKITVQLVQEIVANHYHIDPASLCSSARTRKISLPRQIAMYLARELTNLSLPAIGRNFGGRDHTTVMHACKKVERTQSRDQQLKQNIMQIRELITG